MMAADQQRLRPIGKDSVLWAAVVAAAVLVGAGLTRWPTFVSLVTVAALSGLVLLMRPERAVVYALPVALLVPSSMRLLGRTVPVMVVLGAIAVAVVHIAARQGPKAPVPRAITVAWAIYASIIVWLAYAKPHEYGPSRVLQLTILSAGPLYLANRFLKNGVSVRRLIDVLLIVGAMASLLAISELFGGYLLEEGGSIYHPPLRDGYVRVQGVWPHPIIFGLALALLLPLAVGGAMSATRRREQWAYVAAAGLYGLTLVFTLSRGSWVAAMLAILVLAGLLTGGRRVAVIGAVFAGSFIVAASPFGGPVSATVAAIFSSEGGEASANVEYRGRVLDEVLSFGRRNPLGAGPGGVDEIPEAMRLAESSSGNRSVDNTYGVIVFELGWVGLLAFAGVVLSVLHVIGRGALRARKDPAVGPLLAAIAAGQVGLLAASVSVASIVTFDQLIVLYWLVAGAGLALCRHASARDAPANPPVQPVLTAPRRGLGGPGAVDEQ